MSPNERIGQLQHENQKLRDQLVTLLAERKALKEELADMKLHFNLLSDVIDKLNGFLFALRNQLNKTAGRFM